MDILPREFVIRTLFFGTYVSRMDLLKSLKKQTLCAVQYCDV